MSLVICPGIHEPDLTQSFLARLGEPLWDYLVFPAERYPAYSAFHILDFLHRQFRNPLRNDRSVQHWVNVPLVFISFSAGVVGAIGAAWAWQLMGGHVKAFIALDGWGAPLYGEFPIHRVSHDHFTHCSSALLGDGADSFYADPPVGHLDLWRSPDIAQGHWVSRSANPFSCCSQQQTVHTSAADFLLMLLARYGEGGIKPRAEE